MGLRMLTKLCVLLSGTVSPWPGSSGRERVGQVNGAAMSPNNLESERPSVQCLAPFILGKDLKTTQNSTTGGALQGPNAMLGPGAKKTPA